MLLLRSLLCCFFFVWSSDTLLLDVSGSYRGFHGRFGTFQGDSDLSWFQGFSFAFQGYSSQWVSSAPKPSETTWNTFICFETPRKLLLKFSWKHFQTSLNSQKCLKIRWYFWNFFESFLNLLKSHGNPFGTLQNPPEELWNFPEISLKYPWKLPGTPGNLFKTLWKFPRHL